MLDKSQVGDLSAPLYSAQEAAELTGRKSVTVYAMASKHKLGTRIGRTLWFSQGDIEFIKSINPLGGRPPQDGGDVQYAKDPSEVKKGRPHKSRGSVLKTEPVSGMVAGEAADDDAQEHPGGGQ